MNLMTLTLYLASLDKTFGDTEILKLWGFHWVCNEV